MDTMENEKLFIDAKAEELNDIFGEKATTIIFDYLETTFRLPRNHFPHNLEEFNRTMEVICGKKAAPPHHNATLEERVW
ncbi:MAG: hypothetical protein V1915_00590 [Candidatus Bathyarchaeota archaeon]